MWECGLKLMYKINTTNIFVTPRVGVWIETCFICFEDISIRSLPVWKCGLKLDIIILLLLCEVTPRVGVWIETMVIIPLFRAV